MAKSAVGVGPVGRRVARAVARLRAEQGMSQQDLAQRIIDGGHRLSRSSLAQIEVGHRRVDADDLAALSGALGSSPDELLGQEASS